MEAPHTVVEVADVTFLSKDESESEDLQTSNTTLNS